MTRKVLSFQELQHLQENWPGHYFILSELLKSDNARAKGLDNFPTAEEYDMIQDFVVECLDPIRQLWGRPILVNDAFRDPEVNKLAGGVETSDHRFISGGAADIRTGKGQLTIEGLYQMIVRNAKFDCKLFDGVIPAKTERRFMADDPQPVNKLMFDQLILYEGRIHVGWRPEGNRFELRVHKVDPNPRPSPQAGKVASQWPFMTQDEFKQLRQ